MMQGDNDPVLDGECIARYARPRHVHSDGAFDEAAVFVCREADEDGLSINRMAKFSGTFKERLESVVDHLRLKVTKDGRFACFSVEAMRAVLKDRCAQAQFLSAPLKEPDLEYEPPYPPDPSHALIAGLPIARSADEEEWAVKISTEMARVAVNQEPPKTSPRRKRKRRPS